MKRKTFSLSLTTLFCVITLSLPLFTGCFGDDDKTDTPVTPPGDTTAPTVTSTVPASGTTSASNTDLVITVTFDEPIDTSTVSVNTLNNLCDTGSIQVSRKVDDFDAGTCYRFQSGGVTVSNGDKTFSATINGAMFTGTPHYLKIKSTVTDVAGNALTEYKIIFDTP